MLVIRFRDAVTFLYYAIYFSYTTTCTSSFTCIGDGAGREVELEAVEGALRISSIADSGAALSDVEGGGQEDAAALGGMALRRLGIGMRGVTVSRSDGRVRSVSSMSDADARELEDVGTDAEVEVALDCS